MTDSERTKINELVDTGRVAEAVGTFNRWLDERPNARDLLYRKAYLIVRFGENPLRLHAAETFAARFPDHAGGPFLVGYAKIDRGEVDEGLRELDRSQALGMLATSLQAYREWAENVKAWTVRRAEISESATEFSVEAASVVAKVKDLALQGRIFEANESWLTILRDHPNVTEVDRARALFLIDHLRLKQVKAAEDYAEKWPDASDADMLRARALFAVGNFDEALRAVDQAERRWGVTEWSDAERIRIEAKLGKPPGRQCVSRESYGLITLRRITAQVEAQPPLTEETLSMVASGLEDLGNDPVWTAVYVSHWYGSKGNWSKAAAVLERALDLRPRSIHLHYGLSRAEEAAGNRAAAISWLERAQAHYPTSAGVARELSKLHWRSWHPIAAVRVMWSFLVAAVKTQRPA